jgi:hypothetical protein
VPVRNTFQTTSTNTVHKTALGNRLLIGCIQLFLISVLFNDAAGCFRFGNVADI